MQRMQRKFGTFLPRTANEQQVGTLLNDFEEADQMLAEIMDATDSWKQAWNGILNRQLAIVAELEFIYQPIVAAGAGTQETQRIPAKTPQFTLDRTHNLKEAYKELKMDMANEVIAVDKRIITPAREARDGLKNMKKVIKKREDKKLDFERYQSRVAALDKKTKLSEREQVARTKHQGDVERTAVDYEAADQHLRSVLPGILNAVFALLPHLLAAQIEIQNALLGHLYTVLNEYATQHEFPLPPPELEEVIAPWDADFTPLRKELETEWSLLKGGKAVMQPMGQQRSKSYSGLHIRDGVADRRRPSGHYAASPSGQPRRIMAPTYESTETPPAIHEGSKPRIPMSSKPNLTSKYSSSHLTPAQSPGAEYALTRTSTASSATSQSDYFSRGRNQSGSTSAASTPGLGKKKPPPPPPPKKKIGSFQAEYVVAMYDFDGQNDGDLTFREGDKIRVAKKTESSQDWWEGELHGVKGAFPANYVR